MTTTPVVHDARPKPQAVCDLCNAHKVGGLVPLRHLSRVRNGCDDGVLRMIMRTGTLILRTIMRT